MASLFSDFLTALGVRHTETYSDRSFAEMPFQSMYGLAHLLGQYGVGTSAVEVPPESRAAALQQFPLPFLADTPDGFAIVTATDGGNVTYRTQHRTYTAPAADLLAAWNGIALLAATDSSSTEPKYTVHHIADIANHVKRWVLVGLVAALVLFAMWAGGLWRHPAAWVIAALDCAGIWLSWMLVEKSMGVEDKKADTVCSALEEGGCDEIAQSQASSFMDIFKWSEVGLAYFSVSLLTLLMFPGSLTALAAINILCLPYTVWSITYQKFVAKVWCTLCVCVQATLWALFFAYLAGGYVGHIFPLYTPSITAIIVLGCTYGAVLLGINALDNAILKHFKPNNSNEDSHSA